MNLFTFDTAARESKNITSRNGIFDVTRAESCQTERLRDVTNPLAAKWQTMATFRREWGSPYSTLDVTIAIASVTSRIFNLKIVVLGEIWV
jgi:hypothetical protein